MFQFTLLDAEKVSDISGDINLLFFLSDIDDRVLSFLESARIFFIIASVILLVGILWVNKKMKKLMAAEHQKFMAEHARLSQKKEDARWDHITTMVASPNPNDWRQAIIEADVMLEGLLRGKGYPGDTLGEILKGLQKGDFLTLDDAWEAHKMRNTIAHQGSDFILTQREARRVIDLFRKVFDEFNVI